MKPELTLMSGSQGPGHGPRVYLVIGREPDNPGCRIGRKQAIRWQKSA